MTPLMSLAQYNIGGTVRNSQGDGVVFADVFLKNQKTHTHSKEDGTFSIHVGRANDFNDTLVVRFVGYTMTQIPVYFRGENVDLGTVVLVEKNTVLKEVQVLPPPPVEKIMKLAFKRVKKNYINSEVDLQGFYRETSFENDVCIGVNEGVVEVDYSKYTKRQNMSQRFRDYYKNEATNLNDVGNVFRYLQYFPFYTTRDDEVYIPFSRKSHNLSTYKNNPAPYGGPNDLLAMDKVKFLYDFLDPKMGNKYIFKNLGKQEVDGVMCYKISYTPKIIPEKEKQNRVWHPISKKMKYSIYAGFIYVDIKSYAVLGFEGQTYLLTDFSIYRRKYPYFSYPDFFSFEVSYKKNEGGKYVLSSVETEKTRTIKYNTELIRYKSKRLLHLYEGDGEYEKDADERFL